MAVLTETESPEKGGGFVKKILATMMTLTFPILSYAGFNYSNFDGRYEMTTDCFGNGSRYVSIVSNPAEYEISGSIDGQSNIYFVHFEHINRGKARFNSCWEDGFVGYTETEADGNKITEKTVIQRPGFLCSGGLPRKITRVSLELKGDKLVYKYKGADQHDTCILKRIRN